MEAFKLESLRATHGNNPTHLSYGTGKTYTNPSTDSRAALCRGHHTLLASYLQEKNKQQVPTQKPQVQMVMPTIICSQSCKKIEHTPLGWAGKATNFLLPKSCKSAVPPLPTRESFLSPRCPGISFAPQDLFRLPLPQL